MPHDTTGLIFLGFIFLIAAAPWLAHTARRDRAFLHLLQLEEYETGRFFRWLLAHRARLFSPLESAIGAGLTILALALLPLRSHPWAIVPLLGLWVVGGMALLTTQRRPASRKPLVLTPKALLIWALAFLVGLVVGVAAAGVSLHVFGGGDSDPYAALCGFVIGSWVAGQGSALNVLAGNAILFPLQAVSKTLVVRLAATRLRQHKNLTIIGIAGSYGKTSTKEILAALLGAKYKVLKTPASFNTPLGISRVILRNLRSDHQIFVVELGEYYRGDIAQLCRLARPHIGIVTAVNPQHLERLGTIENIAATMYELIEALPPGGVAIFNNDNEWCRTLAGQAERHSSKQTVIRFGLDSPYIAATNHAEAMDIWADEIATDSSGVSFALHSREGGQRVRVRVPLLGRHNVRNVLAAAAAARAVGMSLREIALAAAQVQPIPARLQLMPSAGGVTVINDGYNGNPDGVAAGLEVLREMAGKRKVLVTPGLVELGSREAEENRVFGRLAARVCDTVILVGRRRIQPILEGLREESFPSAQTIVVRRFDEVQPHLKQILQPGDVVLYANDLPDIYDEDEP